MNRGFTVVEILITLVVMTVLLTLGVVSVRSTLANARDAEREEDIAVLARGFESYYDRGVDGNTPGSYPGYNDLWFGAIWVGKPLAPYSIGSSDANWKTPTGGGLSVICLFESPSGLWPTIPGCETPGNLDTVRSRVSPDQYGYESISRNGGFCYVPDPLNPDSMCTRFNLYWINEEGVLKVHKSKHR